MKTILITCFVTLALFSCREDADLVLSGNNNLVGTWVYPQYNDTLITYTKAAGLIENEPGYTFKADNSLISRQNSSWCGTPPITTADYEGTWSWSDSIVTISTDYWGGKADFTWRVISLDNNRLVITVLTSDYQEGK